MCVLYSNAFIYMHTFAQTISEKFLKADFQVENTLLFIITFTKCNCGQLVDSSVAYKKLLYTYASYLYPLSDDRRIMFCHFVCINNSNIYSYITHKYILMRLCS